MTRKKIIKIIYIILISLIVLFGLIYSGSYIFLRLKTKDLNKETPISNNSETIVYEEYPNTSNLPTAGNNVIITNKSVSDVRIINEYDEDVFRGNNCILIMWGSWCTNCEEEMPELEKIVNYYKDSDIKIFLISHDFYLDTLISYLESSNLSFNTQVLFDEKRVIRNAIDPDEGTIPVCYFLNTNAEIVKKINGAITLKDIKSGVKEVFK